MKITIAFLLLLTAFIQAEDEEPGNSQPNPKDQQAEVTRALTERKATELILKGDASALAGDREKALSLWNLALAHKISGDRQNQDAAERLKWACPDNEIGGLFAEDPGQAFAQFMRKRFLGANEVQRKNFIHEFCEDANRNDPHPEFDAYGAWIREMLPLDKNFDLLPLILEGPLADNHQWLSQTLASIGEDKFLKDPPRIIKALKGLGFLGDARSFRSLSYSEDGKTSVFASIVNSLLNDTYKTTREAVKKHLMELQTRTLGADLFLALLKNGDTGLASFLRAHSSELKAMEQSRRDEILAVIKPRSKGYPNTEDMDDELVSLLRPLLPEGELTAIKLEDRLSGVLIQDNLIRDEAGTFAACRDAVRLIACSADHQPAKARAGLKYAIKILRNNTLQCNSDYAPSEKPLAALLGPLLFEPELFNFVLEQVDEAGLLVDTLWLDNVIFAYWNWDKFRCLSGQRIVALFLSSDRFVAEAEKFQPHSTLRESTILGSLLERLHGADEGVEKTVLQELRAQHPRTFGSEMIEIMITRRQNEAEDFIKRRSPEFVKIPAARRDAVMISLRKASGELRYPERLSPELRAMLQPLLTHDPAEVKLQVERLMRASSLASLNLTPKSCLLPFQRLLNDVAQLDPGQARDLAHKVEKLISQHPADRAGQHAEEFSSWQATMAGVPELFGFYTDEFEKNSGVNLPGWVHYVHYHTSYGNLPMRSIKMLEAGRFLDEAPSFRAYLEGREQRPQCWLAYIVGSIKSDKQALASANDFLSKKNPTFGVDLVKALLSEKPDSVSQFISSHCPDLEKLPAERYPEILYFCGLRCGSWLQLASTSKQWNLALESFLPAHKIRVTKSSDEILAATRLEELEPGIKDHNPMQWDLWWKWLDAVSEMMMVDSQKASRAFEHLLQLASAADEQIDGNRAQNESSNKVSNVENLMLSGGKFPVLFKLCLSSARSSRNLNRYLNQLGWGLIDIVTDPTAACLLVESMGYLTDAEKFDPSLSCPHYENDTLGGTLVERMVLQVLIDDAKSRYSGVRERLLEYLPQRQPQTFGSDLLQALLDKNGARSVDKFLKSHHDDLSKLPAASRKPVLGLLRKTWPKMPRLAEEQKP